MSAKRNIRGAVLLSVTLALGGIPAPAAAWPSHRAEPLKAVQSLLERLLGWLTPVQAAACDDGASIDPDGRCIPPGP
jgi:hypothetical protein